MVTATGLERETFCRAYYDAGLSYAKMTALLGVSRAALDAQRREWGLPSRRWVTDWLAETEPVAPDLPEWTGPSKHDYVSGRAVQWWLWDRRRLPGPGLLVSRVRVIATEMYCELR